MEDRAPARVAVSGASSGAGSEAPWLLNHKVDLPDVVAGYMERPHLEERCLSVGPSLLVLHAPGGFGKTALLARCCSRLRDQGVPVAWLSFDEQDGAVQTATYLALAFERAGVGSFGSLDEGHASDASAVEYDSQSGYRINRLIRAIERHAESCVLALDDVDRLRKPEAVAVLNDLMSRAPRNLRFAMAFRERPTGLDIAMFILEGRGETIGAEDLRFSDTDIVRFFETKPTRRELATLRENTAGWPIALRLYRNARQAGTRLERIGGGLETISAWIESRLWRGLTAEDRDFVLDISLFDWIDFRLIDEATGGQHSRRRIDSMQSLNGLLQSTGGGDASLCLHPLIRQYCANRRYQEDPERYVFLHRRIARALARRGHVLEALRHGSEAGDSRLVGEIAESAGGIKLWIERGFDALCSMDGWLTPEVVASYPRLALVRSVVLAMKGQLEEARRVYHAASLDTAGFTCSPDGTEDAMLQTDHLIVLGVLLVLGCNVLTRYEAVIAQASRTVRMDDMEPVTSGMLSHGYCVLLNEMNDFDRAAEWRERARSYLGHNTRYMSPHIEFQAGLVAVAHGRTQEAADCYDRALKVARAGHLGDATTVLLGEILLAELELERGAGYPDNRPPCAAPSLLVESGAWFDIFAANTDVSVEVALLDGKQDEALAIVERGREHARSTERIALVRYLSALRVSLLVRGRRVDDAGRAWRGDRLPNDSGECLDLKTHRWRDVETVASARLRLLTACEEYESAREFANDWRTLASERGLLRMRMRALALSVRLEHQAGDAERATGHLLEYLQLFAEADFLWPLSREQDIALPMLDRVANAHRPQPVADVASAVAHAIRAANESNPDWGKPMLTPREMDVLARLESKVDNDIASELRLSYHGVRYRIRCIFAKLGARGRFDAVLRARELGILARETAD